MSKYIEFSQGVSWLQITSLLYISDDTSETFTFSFLFMLLSFAHWMLFFEYQDLYPAMDFLQQTK